MNRFQMATLQVDGFEESMAISALTKDVLPGLLSHNFSLQALQTYFEAPAQALHCASVEEIKVFKRLKLEIARAGEPTKANKERKEDLYFEDLNRERKED